MKKQEKKFSFNFFKKKEEKKPKFKYEYISYTIIIIGLLMTFYGLGFMAGNIMKYKNWDIINSTVANYNVKTEGTGSKINKTSYLYTVKYELDNKAYQNNLPDYIEDEKHFGDVIAIVVNKDNHNKIDIYHKNTAGIKFAGIGLGISIIGFLVYIIIKKFYEK